MLTLREAYQDYIAGRKHELSPRSIGWMDQKVETYMVHLLDKPLEEITPRACRALHEELSRTSGRYSSNGALRVLKAVWNDAARTYDLPPNPVSRGVRMNKEYPAELTITLEDLPKLWRDLEAIEDPIKRTCWLTLMMTGLRSHDARSMEWEQIDGDGVLHLPNPKGGKAKAFDLPLCDYLIGRLDHLDRRSDYVFPSRRPYLTELRRTPEFDHNPHPFRRLYRTLCVEAEVDFTTSKLLLNHSMASDISFRYISRAQLLGPMKQAAEKVAKLLLSYRRS
jgi:integrase